MVNLDDRTEVMVALYGEVCKKQVAAKILDCGVQKINAMLEDGRLDPACGGTRVDVRSIARYIAAPEKENHEARMRKMKQKRKSDWAVS